MVAARVRRAAMAAWPGRHRLPGFLIIGTKRSGSTSLHRYLVRHPNIVEPGVAKGTRYFDLRYERGPAWYRRRFPPEIWMKAVERRRGGPVLTGEASAYYGYHPLAVPRAATDLPDVKMIVVVRDPVDRLWSQYNYEVSRGFEDLSLEEALAAEPERTAGHVERIQSEPGWVSFAHRHHSYLDRSRYASEVERAIEAVGRDRLMVVAAEDLFADPQATMDAVWAFLGLDSHDLGVVTAAKANTYDPIPAEVRDRLARVFADDNERLFDLLGRRLPWTPHPDTAGEDLRS